MSQGGSIMMVKSKDGAAYHSIELDRERATAVAWQGVCGMGFATASRMELCSHPRAQQY